MRNIRPIPLTVEELQTKFSYDPEKGILKRLSDGRWEWGCSSEGYPKVLGVGYVHRIIWKMHAGSDAIYRIDHRNQIRDDNRWVNLREATASQNRFNGGIDANNTSGHRGVFFQANKWRAQITVQNKKRHLGYYATREQASAAYKAAAKLYAGEFATL